MLESVQLVNVHSTFIRIIYRFHLEVLDSEIVLYSPLRVGRKSQKKKSISNISEKNKFTAESIVDLLLVEQRAIVVNLFLT